MKPILVSAAKGARQLARKILGRHARKPTDAFGRKAVPTGKRQHIQADVCILTNCRFPGGNASSTLDEIRTFAQAGLQVAIVHCPLNRNPVSERYSDWLERMVHIEDVNTISCRLLIVRGPRVIMSESIDRLQNSITTRRAAFVINNSAYRPDGTIIFQWNDLIRKVNSLPWTQKLIFPLGPAIRQEIKDEGLDRYIAIEDWSPTFDEESIPFIERQNMSPPFTIGRHGRDGGEKWLENPRLLRAAYPAGPSVKVRILGGADKAADILGSIPDNWTVYPFGAQPVDQFLRDLDAFVYFPHSDLNEAFGRTIVESMYSGLPVILPSRFELTFGNLAIYSNPENVVDVLYRLSYDHKKRLKFVRSVREQALSTYGSKSLFSRAPELEINSSRSHPGSLEKSLVEYKRWIEKG